MVKGDGAATAAGAYGLAIESIDSGASSMGCGASPLSPDAFFRFIVTEETQVTIDTEDSALDTVIGR